MKKYKYYGASLFTGLLGFQTLTSCVNSRQDHIGCTKKTAIVGLAAGATVLSSGLLIGHDLYRSQSTGNALGNTTSGNTTVTPFGPTYLGGSTTDNLDYGTKWITDGKKKWDSTTADPSSMVLKQSDVDNVIK